MKSFKQFNKDSKKQIPFLSWDSSHGEARDRKELPFLSWDSSHGEVRNNKKTTIKESFDYDSEFHHHPDVEPKKLSEKHKKAIHEYAADKRLSSPGASTSINAYLRNRSGEEKQQYIHSDHKENDVHHAVKTLSSAFTKENTNKKPIVTHGGLPERIGKKLMDSGKHSEHHLAGFTSTSSDKETAKEFAGIYARKQHSKDTHVAQYHIHPHAGLSIVKHSPLPYENEVLLHHGARIKYSHTDKTPNESGGHDHVHHVEVFPEHKKIEHYGEYTPKQK